MPETINDPRAEATEAAIAAAAHGSDMFYRHWLGRLIYTAGVQAVAEAAGAYWLIDTVASTLPLPRVRAERFQVWVLEVDTEARQGVVRMGGDRVDGKLVRTASSRRGPAYVQTLPYTDFPLPEFTLYCEWNGETWVLMLPGER